MDSVLMLKYASEGPRPVAPRTFRFVASTSARDRDMDVIEASGWDLTGFSKNPVILLNHDRHSLPVAKGRAWVEGNRLMVDITFPEPGVSAAADQAHDLVAGGFIRAVSVGFRALEAPTGLPDGRGYHFTRCELLEVSLVSVPAHQDAVLAAALGAKGRTYAVMPPPIFAVSPATLKALLADVVADVVLAEMVAASGALDVEGFRKNMARLRGSPSVDVHAMVANAGRGAAPAAAGDLGPSWGAAFDGYAQAREDDATAARVQSQERAGYNLLASRL